MPDRYTRRNNSHSFDKKRCGECCLLIVDRYRRPPSFLSFPLSRSPLVPLSSMCLNRLLRSVEMDLIPVKEPSLTLSCIALCYFDLSTYLPSNSKVLQWCDMLYSVNHLSCDSQQLLDSVIYVKMMVIWVFNSKTQVLNQCEVATEMIDSKLCASGMASGMIIWCFTVLGCKVTVE